MAYFNIAIFFSRTKVKDLFLLYLAPLGLMAQPVITNNKRRGNGRGNVRGGNGGGNNNADPITGNGGVNIYNGAFYIKSNKKSVIILLLLLFLLIFFLKRI